MYAPYETVNGNYDCFPNFDREVGLHFPVTTKKVQIIRYTTVENFIPSVLFKNNPIDP
jgi:hypothetical protein